MQLHKNISYHTSMRMTPYEAVYNKKTSFALAHFGVPHEHWNQINRVQDLTNYQHEISETILGEEDVESSLSPCVPISDNDLPSSPPSKFPPSIDPYHDEISQPLPHGTIDAEDLDYFQSLQSPTLIPD